MTEKPFFPRISSSTSRIAETEIFFPTFTYKLPISYLVYNLCSSILSMACVQGRP